MVICWEDKEKGHVSTTVKCCDPKLRSWSAVHGLNLHELVLTCAV